MRPKEYATVDTTRRGVVAALEAGVDMRKMTSLCQRPGCTRHAVILRRTGLKDQKLCRLCAARTVHERSEARLADGYRSLAAAEARLREARR